MKREDITNNFLFFCKTRIKKFIKIYINFVKHTMCLILERRKNNYYKNIYKFIPLCYHNFIKNQKTGGCTMETSNKGRTLQWINNQYQKGNISFSHKLQRPVGQWNNSMKSLLIHSLLSGFPVNPIYCVEENNIIYTLDGSQRTSACISYINNEFALSKDTPLMPFSTRENGEVIIKKYDIAGKKFKKLTEDLQSTLLACNLDFCTLSNYTDDEVKEMFKRQNAGKPLNGKHLRVVYESDEFSDVVYSLSKHPFMNKLLTNTQRKNGTDRELIIQALMLICTDQKNEFTSFRKKDIDCFVIDHADKNLSKATLLKDVLDGFNGAFDDIKMPVTSIPMILYSGYRVKKDKKSFQKFIEIINKFIENYNTNEDYKKFVKSGTGNSENVRGRFEYWKNLIRMA